jgi:hypothetical protein
LVQNIFYPIDVEAILKIKPSRRLDEDVLAWKPKKTRAFSIHSAYRLALSAHLDQCDITTTSFYPDGKQPCWTKIGKALVPQKVKTFAWNSAVGVLELHLAAPSSCTSTTSQPLLSILLFLSLSLSGTHKNTHAHALKEED